MGKSYLTADWHAGESTSPGNASFLRPLTTRDMVEQWLAQANRLIRTEDTLIFVGESVVNLESLAILARLPKCKRLRISSLAPRSTRPGRIHMHSPVTRSYGTKLAGLHKRKGANDTVLHRRDDSERL